MSLLFIYGTLRQPDIQKTVFGGPIVGSADSLRDFALGEVVVVGKTYLNLVARADSTVDGMVIEVNEEQLRNADEFETEKYSRQEFLLASGRRAEAYIAK